MAVGDLIYAGQISYAVWLWQTGGGGSTGWDYARDRLRRQFPTEHVNSINALINQAQNVVAVGNRYRPAGPTFVPAANTLPDMRPPERRAGIPPGMDPTNPPPARVFTEGIVEVRSSEYGGGIVQRFSVTIPSDAPLSKEQVLAELARKRNDWLGLFGHYDDVEDRLGDLTATVRIVGAWRGY